MRQIIDRDQVQELMRHGAQVVEVLPAKQFEEFHLPEARNLPLTRLDAASVRDLDPARPVIVYCYDYQ